MLYIILVLAAIVGVMVYLHMKHNKQELALEAKLKELETKVLDFFKNLGHH